jgi:hypothetical protein
MEALDTPPLAFIMTVGVGYGFDQQHPLGLTGKGFSVIEAPSKEIAYRIAQAITQGHYADLYDCDTYTRERLAYYYPDGEQLRFAWMKGSAAAQIKELAARDALHRPADATEQIEATVDLFPIEPEDVGAEL